MVHKTIAGYIPDSWKGVQIKNICKVVRGSSPRPAGSPLYFNGDFLPWITVADITNTEGMYLIHTRSMLTELGAKNTRITEPETLMLANSGATLGVPKISMIKSGANDGIAMLLDLNGATKEFVYYYLASKTQFFREVLAPGVGQPNLNTELIGDLPIPIPPIPEQKKIAQILSTWDKAIAVTEKLLTNSQQQKKALMQQLFSGKKRLLDENGVRFSGEWKQKPLGELADVYQPKTISQSVLTDSGYPVYGANGIIGFYNEYNHLSEQIAVTCRGSTCGVVNWTQAKSWITGNAMVVNTDNNPQVSKKFLYYVLAGSNLTYLISGSGQPQITGTIKNHIVKIPDIQEQQKIATVLSAADAEIATLEKKLAFLKDEKKALMQQLLTGKRRVKVDEAVAA